MKSNFKAIGRFFFVLREINLAFTRGSLGASVRYIQENLPLSWEFSAFSQNGEDGIVDYLISKQNNTNKYFIEIGSANGIANNTAYLAFSKKYCGIMVEGGKVNSKLSRIMYRFFNSGVVSLNMFVDMDNIHIIFNQATHKNPDVFSIDIDGNDYYLTEWILKKGYRPSIFIVEYNANYGPEKAITIKYISNFNYAKAHYTRLYYGVSIMAWRKLFSKYNYHFVTVDSNGVNAFFIHKDVFPNDFLDNLNGCEFKDHVIETEIFKKPWNERFKLIENMPYQEV